MAERLKIDGNVLVVFEDGNESIEYIRAKRCNVVPRFDSSDNVQFFQEGLIGVNTQTFNSATIINDLTGLAFTSVPYFKSFLSANLSGCSGDVIPVSSGLTGRIVVNESNKATTIFGTIDSTKEYFLDGEIDPTGYSCTIPAGGLHLRSYDFEIGGFKSSAASQTLFISPIGGSGNLIMFDLFIEASGAGSKVYDLTSATGNEAIEVVRVNYNNLVSMGDLYNYRQGLETGTGRFGGSPSLTLHGTWLGGFTIRTSIVRGMDSATTEPLFKAGTLFVMNSRFLTDMNVDLGTLQPLLDFSNSNFTNPSTLQLRGTEVTRGGVYNSEDVNITPNIDATYISSFWVGNNGIGNTHVGGYSEITTEVTTTISVQGDFYPLLGTYTTSDLQHFDVPANSQLRHIGNTPRDFNINCYVVLDGSANEVIDIRIRKYDNSTGLTSTVISQLATVNNFSGGNDRCTFTILGRTALDLNDYIYPEVANTTGVTDVTAQLSTYMTVSER